MLKQYNLAGEIKEDFTSGIFFFWKSGRCTDYGGSHHVLSLMD